MIQFQSEPKEFNKNAEALFLFLADANNFIKILPDNLENFKSDIDSCQFTISKFGNFELKIMERIPNSKIRIEPVGKTPIKFFIDWKIEANQDKCLVSLFMEADVNPFIKMMVQKPLEDLMKYQIKKLTEIFNS